MKVQNDNELKAAIEKYEVLYLSAQEDMIFKLTGDAEKEAMSLDGAKLFDPMGGRPMGGWVQLSYVYADRWPEFAQKSMDYVKTIKK